MLYILFFLLLLISAIIGAGVVWLIRHLRYIQPSEKEIKDDLTELHDLLSSWKDLYAPIDENMMRVLTQKPTEKHRSESKKGATTINGLLENELHEPFMGYAYRKYIAPGVNGIMYAETAHHEYVFRFTNKGTEVFVDEHLMGKFNKKNSDYFDKDGQLLAQINKHLGGISINIAGKDAVLLQTDSTNLLAEGTLPSVILNAKEIEIREAMLVFYYGLQQRT